MQITNGSRHLVRIWAVLLAASVPVYAGNSRKVNFHSAVILNATQIPPGAYKAQWESHGAVATVTFRRGKHIVATAEGKIVQYKDKFPNPQIVYETNADRSHTLLEIRFAGMNQGIVVRDYNALASNARVETETVTVAANKP